MKVYVFLDQQSRPANNEVPPVSANFTIIFHFHRSFIVLSVELNRKIVMTDDLPGLRIACVFDSGLLNGTLLLGYFPGRAEENHEILWSE